MIATCHTSLYKPLAERCAASFAKFGIKVALVPYYGVASGPTAWKSNTLLKVHAFYEHVVRIHAIQSEDAWIVDADVEAVADPRPMMERALKNAVMAAPFAPEGTRDAKDRDTQVSAGFVGFAGTFDGANAIKKWDRLCMEALKRPHADLAGRALYEQIALIETIESVDKSGLNAYRLPPNYGCRPDLAKGHEPVLVHVPASGAAQMKKKVGSPDCPRGA